jgi:MFS transporter, DHA1 family, multidrug resistance protein
MGMKKAAQNPKQNIKIKPALGIIEFAALGACMMATVALATDIVLPMLDVIGGALNAPSANAVQLIITAFFLGLSVGSLFFGPLSDSIGRKRATYIGVFIFVLGSLISYLAASFEAMLLGRLLQGLGVAGPRIVSVAIVRDLYQGREMARVMSILMGFFILVPILAPSLGKLMITIMPWRMIFVVLAVFAVCIALWLGVRQNETLAPANTRKFSVQIITSGIAEVVRNKTSFGYGIAAGFVFGGFNCYLISSQQVFADMFGITDKFALYFGALAVPMAIASFLNSVLVVKYGMRRLCMWALMATVMISGSFFIAAIIGHGTLPLPAFVVWAGLSFFLIAILFGNFNAIAMEPLGHLAGVGSAVIGSFSTFIAMGIGALIGAIYNQTLLPLIGSFAMLAVLAILVIRWAEKTPSLH